MSKQHIYSVDSIEQKEEIVCGRYFDSMQIILDNQGIFEGNGQCGRI
jgi:hypothetical protein